MLTIESLKNLYVKMGGSLSDTYPFASGTVGEYTYIPYLIEACSQKYSSGGGGGAEKFIVTLTQENDTWTADKTIAEIVAADEAGKEVEAHIVLDMEPTMTVIAQPAVIESFQNFGAAFFYAVLEVYRGSPKLYTVVGSCANEEEWSVTETPLGNSSNAPLIVTMTADESTGNMVGDKTYKEAFDAMQLGIPVTVVIQGVAASRLIGAVLAEGNYYLTYSSIGPGTPTLTGIDGSANDYITINV